MPLKMTNGTSSCPNLMSSMQIDGFSCKKRNKLVRKLYKLGESYVASTEREEIPCLLPSSVRSTFLMVFSPDGSLIASTHGDHRIYITSLQLKGKLIQSLEGHRRTPWCLTFHPTFDSILASGDLSGEVRVWDLKSGDCEIWFNTHGSVIASLAFHPNSHLLLIATLHELHFWDWSQSEAPFITLYTNNEKEKVRFVKFDATGAKLITGISNVPSFLTESLPSRIQLSESLTASPAPSLSLAQRRSNILSRVMSMYRHLEGIESITRNAPSSNNLDELRNLIDGAEATAVGFPSWLSGATSEPPSTDELSNLLERIRSSISAEMALQRMSTPPTTSSAPPPPLLTPPQEDSLSIAREYAQSQSSESSSGSNYDWTANLMHTFRRLHSLCTRLTQLMQERQSLRGDLDGEGGQGSSIQMSDSLGNLLNRLESSLSSMSRAAMRTAIAQEHIQQVRMRVSDILERLVNVTGYRQRLSLLRDQIYGVAERVASGDIGTTATGNHLDLLHCLWLVEMSIHLTRQMQRILAADYRLTQLSLNTNNATNWLFEERNQDSESERDTYSRNNDPQPSTSTGRTASGQTSRYRWMIRSKSESGPSERTNQTDSNNAFRFNIPNIRISPAGPGSSHDPGPSSSRSRPRSPPLNDFPLPPPLLAPPSHHIWFTAGLLPGSGANSSLNYRIQCWDFSSFEFPDLKDCSTNVITSKSRIHNDASIDISMDGSKLVCFVPLDSTSHQINLSVFSLLQENIGTVLFVYTFNQNAISVSLSPMNRFILIGLTSPRITNFNLNLNQIESENKVVIGQIFELSEGSECTKTQSLKLVKNIEMNRNHDELLSLNSIRWIPFSGQGFIYGTNRGNLIICTPCNKDRDKDNDIVTEKATQFISTSTQTFIQNL